jgi:hypothetical protein
MNDLRLKVVNQLSQPPPSQRIDFPLLVDSMNGNARLLQTAFEWSRMGQNGDMHVELIARQSRRQQR